MEERVELSQREEAVLELFENEYNGAEIAKKLGIGTSTVQDIKKRLIAKKRTSQEAIDEAQKRRKKREEEAKKAQDPNRKIILDEVNARKVLP